MPPAALTASIAKIVALRWVISPPLSHPAARTGRRTAKVSLGQRALWGEHLLLPRHRWWPKHTIAHRTGYAQQRCYRRDGLCWLGGGGSWLGPRTWCRMTLTELSKLPLEVAAEAGWSVATAVVVGRVRLQAQP